ncbi:MAG: hypothetical protein IJ285_06580 [Clostridia bacterium]|nr:hypothetical protein [Clostridia bacterium]
MQVMRCILLILIITFRFLMKPRISLVCNETVNSEETFDVYVTVTENSNICGGRITIGYDNTALEIVSVAKESLLTSASMQEKLDYTDSSARISWAGYTNVTSGGNLLKVTFKAKTLYENVNASIYVQEMKFTDFDENVISCTPQNTALLIKAKTFPTFSVECPDEALIGSTIDVKVNITEKSGAFGGRFDLVYDNTKLQIISNETGSIFSDATPITNPSYINKIRLTWAGTSEMLEGGTLLTVTFKVLEVPGEAAFSLENYRIRGDEDATIDVLVVGNSMELVTELVCSTKTTYTEENGQWKFTSAIKNCPETAMIIVALYSGDRMVGLSDITDISNEVSKDLYVNKCSFEKAKVFIWDSLDTLVPISVDEEITYE